MFRYWRLFAWVRVNRKIQNRSILRDRRLLFKILNKHWPQVPIYNDLKELGNEQKELFKTSTSSVEESCQPFSQAGNRQGKEDDRHLGRTCLKLLNTKTHLGRYRKRSSSSTWHSTMCLLTWKVKTATQSFVIPACGIEAPHRRDRFGSSDDMWLTPNATNMGTRSRKPYKREKMRTNREKTVPPGR